MIKNNNIILSQSITKDLGLLVIDEQVEEFDFCGKYIYEKYISETYPDSQSQSMLLGSYAETLLLGSGARGTITDSLPKLRNGKDSVAEGRIQTMMHRMYGYMYAHGIRIDRLNTQVPLIAKYKDKIWLRGEMDIFPTTVNGKLSVVDLKATKDINNTFFTINKEKVKAMSSGCWGDFDKIAKNQPLFYHHIARNFEATTLDGMIRYNNEKEEQYRWLFAQNNDYSDVDFYFFVAGIGKPDIDNQLTHYKYEWTKMREVLLDALIEESISRIRFLVKDEFKKNKGYLCNKCALKDVC